MNFRLTVTSRFFILIICLSGCFQDEKVNGIRVAITDYVVSTGSDAPIKLPPMITQSSWGEEKIINKTGSSNYFINDFPKASWTLDTGVGKIISTPVIQNDRIIALGEYGDIICIDLSSRKTVWSLSILPVNSSKKMVIGGGLAYDSFGSLYVTTSLGELLSISLKYGTIKWRYNIDAPILDAPTVVGSNVFITDTSSISKSISSTGDLNWSVEGFPHEHVRSKMGRPVSFGDLLLLTNSGGSLSAVTRLNGREKWNFKFNSQRIGYAQNAFGAFNGDPGVFGDTIYYGSANGQFNAINDEGESIWEVPVGLQGSPLLFSNSIFFVSDGNELIRLAKQDGSMIWSATLSENNNINHYFTPVLIGSKLWITGSDNYLRSFDPQSGNLLGKILIGSQPAGSVISYLKTIIVYTKSGDFVVVE